jgi:hypothetical protein
MSMKMKTQGQSPRSAIEKGFDLFVDLLAKAG